MEATIYKRNMSTKIVLMREWLAGNFYNSALAIFEHELWPNVKA